MKRFPDLRMIVLLALLAGTAQAEDAVSSEKSAVWPDLKMQVGGLLQIRVIPYDQNDYAQNDPIVLGDPNLDEGFSVRRARLSAEGSLTDAVGFGVELSYDAPVTGNKALTYYPTIGNTYLEYHKGKLPRIRLGVSKAPFGGQYTNSSRRLLFIERAIASEVLTFGYDLGVVAYGEHGSDEGSSFGLKKLRWWAGFYNGSGSVFRDDNGIGDVPDSPGSFSNPFGLLQVLRAEIDLGTRAAPPGESNTGNRSWSDITFQLAANAAGNRTLEARSVGFGGDLGAYVGPLSFQAEILWKVTSPQYTNEGLPEVYADIPAFGWYLQSALFVVPELFQLAMRYESYDGNVHFTDADDLAVFTAGVNYYPYKTDALKAQLNYVRRVETSPDLAVDNDTVYLNFAAYF